MDNMEHSSGQQLVRATSLRGLTVRHMHMTLGTAVGLVYDHSRKRVTHLKLASRVTGAIEEVPLCEVHFGNLDSQELHIYMLRPWKKDQEGAPLVDTLLVKASAGEQVVFVHDAWFSPCTGQIESYELGALPRKASSVPSIRVPSHQLRFSRGQLSAPLEVTSLIASTVKPNRPWPVPLWSTSATDRLV